MSTLYKKREIFFADASTTEHTFCEWFENYSQFFVLGQQQVSG